jgi:UMF1 family MFS transporter
LINPIPKLQFMADMANANMNEAAELSAKELIDSMSDVDKEGLKGWYWYDWANQAYALTVMTVIVPALMANLYNTATGTQSGDGFYALIYGMAMLIVAVTAPALGVIADRIPVKKGMLFWYTVAGIVFCAGMGAAPYFGDGGYKVLALMYVLGSIGFSGGNTIYYAFMPYLAPKKAMDHVSSWGYAYGFMGGSILLLFHLVVLLATPWDTNFQLAVIFVTSALWWWGWGALMFFKTPEPPVLDEMKYEGILKSTKFAYTQVWSTLKEIRKFRVLFLYIVAYLLFYDGVNTINGMASAFGESVLRINPTMNIALLLTVNVVAIPMSIVFGKIASKSGTKFALMLALAIYCAVAVTAVGFAPLELEDDHERYDFQYEWDEDEQNYTLTTLYGRGVDGWVSAESDGDAEFREAFGEWMDFEGEDEDGSSGGFKFFEGMSALIVIGLATAGVGFGMLALMRRDMGIAGLLLILLLSGVVMFGASMMFTEDVEEKDKSSSTLTEAEALSMVSVFDNVSEHRFSIHFLGGNALIDNKGEIGEQHPTMVDQGGMFDWWPETMRDAVWKPLGIGVSLQWIILGFFVGCVMGAAGAQARSMFTMLIPKSRTTEFFGFFGFIGKAAAMLGPFLYAAAVAWFDSRVAIMSIVVVIIVGSFLCSRVDLEEGMRMADEEDARVLQAREAKQNNS